MRKPFALLTLTLAFAAYAQAVKPVPATAKTAAPVVVMAAGDVACEPADTGCHDVAVAKAIVRQHPNAVLALGDMQYVYGDYADFASPQGYDGSWGRFKAITYPVPGNHDYGGPKRNGGAGYYRYFGARAGAPGKGYYSFDLGSWHIVALNTTAAEGGPGAGKGSAQVRWLQADLAAHRNRCTLAYWHHPHWTGYAKAIADREPERSHYLVNALYAGGADLVLTGHLHAYERTTALSASGKVDRRRGMRQFIVGTGGEDPAKATPPAPGSKAKLAGVFGALRLELGDGFWRSSFVTTSGQHLDPASARCV